MDRPLLFLDLETATSRGAPHLLELAALRVEDGEVTSILQTLIRPEVAIDPETTAIHGLIDADVRDAPPAAAALAEFRAFAGEDWMFAHDARRDGETLAFEFARAKLEPPRGPLLCSLDLGRKAFPEAHDHRLETLADLLGLDAGCRHRALADATLCWQIVERALERLQLDRGPALLAAGVRATSIDGSAPPSPRFKPRWRALEHALRDARRVEILYHGTRAHGSPAPARIPIVPRLAYRRGGGSWLEAECTRTGTIKTYALEGILQVIET